jgi:hypothetical protein
MKGCLLWIHRFVTALGFGGLVPLTLIAVLCNARLYLPAGHVYDAERLRKEVVPQLRFIRGALDRGAAEDMQFLFPEGYFFSYALYGLTWVDVGLRQAPGSERHEMALREARWALTFLEGQKGYRIFPADLNPPRGAFYQGWKGWLEGGILKLQDPATWSPEEVAKFQATCELLAASYKEGERPFPSSYHNGTWPLDGIVGVAALCLHDKLFPPKYTALTRRWVETAKRDGTAANGLLVHRVPPPEGAFIQPRGISTAVVTRFAYEIDPVWGLEMYKTFRRDYFARPLGIPGMREYPRGVHGLSDVDSGPLILGLSGSASTTTIAAAQLYGDAELAQTLLNSAESAGFPIGFLGKKRYVFGLVPVADGFIAWSKAAQPWVSPPVSGPQPFDDIVPWWWRWPLHATLIPIALAWWILLGTRRCGLNPDNPRTIKKRRLFPAK